MARENREHCKHGTPCVDLVAGVYYEMAGYAITFVYADGCEEQITPSSHPEEYQD